MTNAEIIAEMEKICKRMGRCKDPHKMWELDIELERLNDMLERGGK